MRVKTNGNMGRRQICLICHHDFTRKWNAERHNKNKHAGRATIVPVHEYLYGPPIHKPTSLRSNTSPSFKKNPIQDVLARLTEEIGKEFEDLEREVQSFPENSRKQVLGFAVYNAVHSPDLKDSMQDSLKTIRNNGSGLLGRMIGCVATYMDIQPAVAQQILRDTLEYNRGRNGSAGSIQL
jgi:hypothetical protein